jgi:hypothetical protein
MKECVAEMAARKLKAKFVEPLFIISLGKSFIDYICEVLILAAEMAS